MAKGKVAILLLLVLVAGLFLVGCGRDQGGAEQLIQSPGTGREEGGRADMALPPDQGVSEQDAKGTQVGEGPPVSFPNGELPGSPIDRKVVKSAELTLAVEDVPRVFARLEQRAEELGGLVAEAQVYQEEDGRGSFYRAYLRLRVPAARFASFLAEVNALGEAQGQRTSSEDVTGTYVDLQARIANLESQELRLREIMTQAKSVNEILQVERELERVRGDIEAFKAQFQALKGQVEYANITINLIPPGTEDGVIIQGWSGFGGRMLAALQRNALILVNALGGFLVFVVGALPYLALLALLVYLGWLLYRRFSRSKEGS